MAFLFEPYNAYQRPPKKKHWMEIAEEEALLHRIQLEEQAQQKELFQETIKQHLALREANSRKNSSNLNNQNVALPQHSSQPASQQVQNGQYAAPAGGGGWVLPQEFEKTEIASFTLSPTSGIGPLAVSFTNTTISPLNDTFLWNFGSGSLTSSNVSPSPITYSALGTYTVTLQETSSQGNKSVATQTVTVIPPTLTANFTYVSSSGAAPSTVTFTNTINGTGTQYNGTGILTYFWSLGSGSLTSTGIIPSPTTYRNGGPYLIQLQVTESLYNVSSSVTKTFTIA